MPANPNTADIMATWIKAYQLTHYKQPVFRAIAVERIGNKLKVGDTFHRTYSSDFVVNNMGGDGSYSTQPIVDTDETLVVNQKKEVSFYIPEWQELQMHLPTRTKYAQKAMYRLFNQIDGDLLANATQNAGTVVDDGSLGGTAGNGLTVGVGNVAAIFYSAMQQLQLQNIVYNPNALFTGDFKVDRRNVMPVAIISPQFYNQLMQFLGGKNSQLGDRVAMNGHLGAFAGWNLFVSNNLMWEGTLTLPVNPSNNDTITINGVAFTFVTTLGSTPGNILIGGSASATATNVQAALSALGTTTSTFVALSTANQNLLANLTATNPTGTTVKVVMTGFGTVVVSQAMTSNQNLWTATAQKQHCLFGVSQSIDLVIQRRPGLVINPVSGKIGKDFVTWNLYGYKVFKEQVPQLIDVQINSSTFGAPVNALT